MARIRALLTAVVLSSLIAACGGGSSSGGSGGSGGTGGTGGGGTGGTAPTNPCLTAMLSDTGEVAGVGAVAGSGVAPDPSEKKTLIDGNPRGRVYEARALHEAAQRKREGAARAAAVTDEGFGRAAITTPTPVAEDIGEIAVVQDTGDLIVAANPYDVRSTGLRFTRNGTSYALSRVDGNFRSTLGNRVTLSDDDSANVNIPFSFPFYGTGQTAAFVNSDGNITFGEEDKSSTERNIARLLTGPPRVAPFFADLDPSTGVGKIFVNAAADGYTVTWCSVRGFDSVRTVTTQATLFPDGSVEMKFSDGINVLDAVVGISPGHTGEIALVDLTTSTASSTGAIGERFAQANTIDTFAVAKKFYQTHPDNYDQILLWTDQPLIPDAFAYELTVANEVRGIGQDIYDLSRSLGSAGRLRSLVVMDWLGKYPEDPAAKFLGENSTLSVLGQEVGHRWLSYMDFRDRTGARSDALLGRDLAHWSFFFDSDASVMEGNDIEDQGGGQFRTVEAVKRFSRLDQYAMGLVGVASVPPFFYVENPAGTTRTRESAPAVGVSFTGTKREVLIEDVVTVMGSRLPSVADSSKTHRQAFIYVVSNGRTLDSGQASKLDRIRREWETFFRQATESRMTADTRLR
jgi:hypothetical protein